MKIPKPIELDNKTISFARFIIDNTLTDSRFGQDYDSLELAQEIKCELEAYESNCLAPNVIQLDNIKLSQPALDLLKQVIKNPSRPYNPAVGIQLLPFLRAVVKA